MLDYDPDEDRREVGTVVMYSCMDGFIYNAGDENRTCQETIVNGMLTGATWTGTPGVCTGYYNTFIIILQIRST